MPAVELWCRVRVVGPDGTEVAGRVLEGPGTPDLAAVDELARIALRVSRSGGLIVLSEVSSALRDLLDLAGLGVEMEWQAELGKEPLGIQEGEEEGHPGDLAP
jgi:hypothetical protein